MALDTLIVNELISEIAGKDVVVLVELIKGKEKVSEFKIAEKLGLTVNQVRNMLYRLYSNNIVSFLRKKDKRKGWYIYYWTFDEKKAYELFVKTKKNQLRILGEKLENEGKLGYFACPNECARLKLEDAMDYDFKCPDCGSVLQEEDDNRIIANIKKEITRINEQLAIPFVERIRKEKKKKLKKVKKIIKKKVKKIIKKKKKHSRKSK